MKPALNYNRIERIWKWSVLIAFMYMAGSLLTGCMSHQKLARRCAIEFPPKVYDSTRIEVVHGDTEYLYDTVTVDCDSVLAASNAQQPTNGHHTATVHVPCPPSTHRVDTIKSTSVRQVENTAKIEVLTIDRDKYRAEAIKVAERRNAWRLIALIALLYMAIRIIVRYYFKFNLP